MTPPVRSGPEADLSARVQHVLATVHRLRRGERVLIGVSGGPDSVVLLHLLTRLAPDWSVKLSVVHVDHQLRPDAGEDAAFVERLGQQWKVPVTVVGRAVRHTAAQEGRSLEDAARQVRYRVFQDVARQTGASRVALAHTADDQAETVLMRLLRGSGLTGLSAIPASRPLGELDIMRPLLGIWRSEILAYAARHHLTYRQDPTNEDPRFVRNRIRHHLLPLLEREYNPQIKAQLVQLAEQCRTDEACLQATATRHWKRLVKPLPNGVTIRLEAWRRQPLAIQQHLFRLAIAHVKGDLQEFEYRHWQELEELLADRPVGSLLHLPGGVAIQKTAQGLTLGRHAPRLAPAAREHPHAVALAHRR